jgi:hypothetical protein
MSREDVQHMMTLLLETAKKTREEYKYSGDEKMMPTAFIYGDGITVMMLAWKDEKEKYQMAAAANAMARARKAKSLSFVTDARWVDGKKFSEYYKLPPPAPNTIDTFQSTYHRILREHGGQVKNLPRQLWQEAVIVFTNGPGIPITIQMAPYEEGDYDTIRWLPLEPEHKPTGSKSDMLTDWWS